MTSNNDLSRLTIGLDLGDKAHTFCVLGDASEPLAEGSVRNTKEALAKWRAAWPTATIIMETGSHSPWLSRFLEGLGHRVLVANARKTRVIWSNERKSDRRDAQMLARLGRADPKLLCPIRHRGEATQRDLVLLKVREGLVKARVNHINSVRFLLKSLGVEIPRGWSGEAFARKAAEHLAPAERSLVEPLLELIKVTNEELKLLDARLDALIRTRHPAAQRLQQVPGVGPITALAFVLTIEEPRRFRDSRQVGTYLGLVPKRDQSGATDKQLRISKAGNPSVRKLLVNCAHYILGPFGPESALRAAGQRIAERGGAIAKKRAVIAVARKLAVLLLTLWKQPEATYQPHPQAA